MGVMEVIVITVVIVTAKVCNKVRKDESRNSNSGSNSKKVTAIV